MKAIKFLTLLLCIFTVNLQAQSYNFTVEKGTYTDLVGSTSLNNGQTWDDPFLLIPLGFEFQLFDELINTVAISNGFGGLLSAESNSTPGQTPILQPYGADIIDRGYDFVGNTNISQSNISYIVEGEPGSKILKVEWNNVGFYSELVSDNESTDFTNFQMWLYQGSNRIEYRYGPNSITNPLESFEGVTGSTVGLASNLDANSGEITDGYALLGDPSSPSLVEILANQNPPPLDGIIPNGIIYRFENLSTGVAELPIELKQFKVFPNLVADEFNVSFDASKVEVNSLTITNIAGQVIRNNNFTNNNITVSDLSPGIYFVNFQTNLGAVTKKFVKQ